MKKISFLVMMAFIAMLWSCQKENGDDVLTPQLEDKTDFHEGLIQLGEKLENPYTVSNMRKAYTNLKENNQLKSTFTIEPTHYYIRFLPENGKELELLKDAGLVLFDFPLDYEITQGTCFHDADIEVGKITWQYTAMPVSMEIPNVEYEILDDLYLQENNVLSIPDDSYKSASINSIDWDILENEALKITGNIDEDIPNGVHDKGSYWTPRGTIKVRDNYLGGLIPLEGVKVFAKRWFKWREGYTNNTGFFYTDFFDTKVTYLIKWERFDFNIRSGSYGQAWFNSGDATRDFFNLNIEDVSSPLSYLYAHIHRGAFNYYENHDQWGIKPPPVRELGILEEQLHIGAYDESGQSMYLDLADFIEAATVKVYRYSKKGTKLSSRDIFATTTHELAHASHWEIGYTTGQYIIDWAGNLDWAAFVPESWATGVEAKITSDVYNTNYNTKQGLTIATMGSGYTSIVWDLMDDFNQNDYYGTRYAYDSVKGYTLSEIENALPGYLGSWNNWKIRLKEKYDNPTECFLDTLFNSIKPN